jgi:serine/threonine-protein kinase RsbT
MADESRVFVNDDAGIVSARQTGRSLATQMGFSATDSTLIATAISEIARNMVVYGKGGEIEFTKESNGRKSGLVVRAIDRGPGIPDLDKAMQDGFTTGKGLGLGLPGARRLMDEFAIESTVGVGTTIVMKKWV